MSNQTITIKKYANRRLYNTATSSYVTLQDLSEMVKEGIKFSVYDAKSSEDITRSVLTQIIVDEENKTGQPSLLPINFLRQLISFYGNNLQWMIPKYLEHSLESFSDNQEKIKAYVQNSFGSIFPFGTTFEEMSKQNMALFENVMRMFSPLNALNFSLAQTEAVQQDNPPSIRKASAPPVNAKTSNTASAQTSAAAHPISSASITTIKAQSAACAINKTMTTAPMSHVQTAIAANSSSEDMQQKIANLQRQLADLAKSRA